MEVVVGDEENKSTPIGDEVEWRIRRGSEKEGCLAEDGDTRYANDESG
jgi:hypothetical protein